MSDEYPPAIMREEINGLKVVADDPFLSGLSKPGKPVAIKGIRRLTLEDDTVVLACNDCVFVNGPDGAGATALGQIRIHRKAEHGVSMGGRRPGAEPVVVPDVAQSMTIREMFEQAAQIGEWEQVFAAQQETIEALAAQRDEALAAQRVAEKELAAHRRKAARALKALGLNDEE